MSGRDEELLSAYFDGELSGDVRLSVEQQLADDVAARELLDELAETSGWVRALPRTTAPGGLHDEVLARLRAARTAAPLHASATHSNWRRRAAWVATSAAGLLLAVVLYRGWPAPDDPRVDGFELAAASQPQPPSDLRGDGVARMYSRETMGEAEFALPLESDSLNGVTPDPTHLAYLNSNQLQFELEQALERGEVPVPGESLAQLGQIGDQVVIFQYRVVDTQDMLDQVQIVLANNGFVPVTSPTSDGAALLADRDANGQLQAFYVESPANNFTAAVDEITRLTSVTAVTSNTVAFVQPVPATSFNFAGIGLEAESVSPLNRSLSVAKSTDAGETRDQARQFSATAQAPAAVTASAKPDGEPADAPVAESLADRGTEPARVASRESQPISDDKSADAYQVRVPARRELLAELVGHQNGIVEGRLAESVAAARSQSGGEKLVRRQSWSNQGPKEAGPPVASRVRAVLLLVPQEPE